MKIGILTHYYKSLNYGGVLQAYALATFLRSRGYEAEQISYAFSSNPFLPKPVCRDAAPCPAGLRGKLLRYRNALRYRLIEKRREEAYAGYKRTALRERADAFSAFSDLVPHSEAVWIPDTVADAAENYDCLITGSDQVWNFDWFNPAFFLDFPNWKGRRIAYAASAGRSVFRAEESAYLRRVLPELEAVSVRESDLAAALNELPGIPNVVTAVDPTMLLSQAEWEAIASPRLIGKRYLFCYFLHNDEDLAQLARKVARKYHLTIAAIPFPGVEYNREDLRFGSRRFDAASPADFLSLIRHAELVLTDSFHAAVFSLLFEKPFTVFPRGDAPRMGSRLQTLTELFGCPERFCTVPAEERYRYVLGLKQAQIPAPSPRFLELVKSSETFLLDSLGKE